MPLVLTCMLSAINPDCSRRPLAVWFSCAALLLAGAMPLQAADAPARSAGRTGYLAAGEHLDVTPLLPAVPEAGSAAQALDEQRNRQYLQQRDTPRWEQAKVDAKIRYPNHAWVFSCAAGVPLTQQDLPLTNELLRRSMLDVSRTVGPAKRAFHRQRPFLSNQAPICTPSGRAYLTKNASYPSGHAAIGWSWALLLTELLPESAPALLARGRDFGDSRGVCNVHWQSDIAAGQATATMVVAQLHGNAAFRQALEAARAEIAAWKATADQSAGMLPGCATADQAGPAQ